MESGAGEQPAIPASPESSEAAAPEVRRQRVENGLRPPVLFQGEGRQTMTIQAALESTGVPGLSVAIINDGAVDWQAGYGTMKADADMPVSDTTLFQAASLAKPVTVLAAMRMRDAGLIDFDRDIETYLKSYSLPEGEQTPGNPVTFRAGAHLRHDARRLSRLCRGKRYSERPGDARRPCAG